MTENLKSAAAKCHSPACQGNLIWGANLEARKKTKNPCNYLNYKGENKKEVPQTGVEPVRPFRATGF